MYFWQSFACKKKALGPELTKHDDKQNISHIHGLYKLNYEHINVA
jgi:hypothetical protein